MGTNSQNSLSKTLGYAFMCPSSNYYNNILVLILVFDLGWTIIVGNTFVCVSTIVSKLVWTF